MINLQYFSAPYFDLLKRHPRRVAAPAKHPLAGLAMLATTALAIVALVTLGLSPVQTLRSVATDNSGTITRTTFNAFELFVFCAVTGSTGLLFGVIFKALISEATARTSAPADSGSLQEKTSKASNQLRNELASVLSLIRAHVQSSDAFARVLTGAQSRLMTRPQEQQIQVIVNLLLAENKRMRADSDQLKLRLEASHREIGALRESLEQAEEAGMTDPLTGVGNRRCFETTLEKAIAAARKSGAALSLVMCDIDHFKRVNDSFGHQVGDEVLKMFCQVITGGVRTGDAIARYGGEEFAIVLQGTGRGPATTIAERVRKTFSDKRLTIRKTNQIIGRLTASFGVAELNRGDDADTLVHRADAKLYEAKAAGRNCVVTAS